jgi:3-hydroxybutyryl-CoA dehydrogenase
MPLALLLPGMSPAVRSHQTHLTVEGPIRSVGVVGAGTMGSGIAQLALEAGHDVRLYDADPAAADIAVGRIREGLARRAARLDLDADAIDDWIDGRVAPLRLVAALDDLAQASQLVIEAAIEDLATKHAIFAALDDAAPRDTILATNTSALSVAAIGAATRRTELVAGLHFFNPAPLMRLVEVVGTPATSEATIGRLEALMQRWDRTPVRSADAPGFIVNRVNRAFTLEPLAALEAEEATVEAIDLAARTAGYPMGPFELMDLIGLDVNLAVSTALHVASVAAGDPDADRFRPSALQARLVAAGRLGRKSGSGFYPIDPAIGPATGETEVGGAAAAVIERTEIAIVDEAYRVLGDGVATASDIDLALRLGASHPIGPFERADLMGGPAIVLSGLRRLADRGPRFTPAPALLEAERH